MSDESKEDAKKPTDRDLETLRRGLDLVRRGRALIRAAENLGAAVDPAIDFGSIPGRSPLMRAEALYEGRRIRDRLFPDGIFSEPVWDILLALFLAAPKGRSIELEAVFADCRLSASTGRRYADLLVNHNLVDLENEAENGPTRAALTPSGLRLMKQFFELTEGVAPRAALSNRKRRA